MTLTRDFNQSIVDRVREDPGFAGALLDEAATLFLNGEAHTARLILGDLVTATVGFIELSVQTAIPERRLHRTLSISGNPSMDEIAAILATVRKSLGVQLEVHTVAA